MLSDDEKVYLLTEEEADALVKKGHGEALRWLESALKEHPERDSVSVLETAKNLLKASMPDLNNDYSELEDVSIEPLDSITDEDIATSGIRRPVSASEHVSEVYQSSSFSYEEDIYVDTAAGAAVPTVEEQDVEEASIFDSISSKYDNIFNIPSSNELSVTGTDGDLMSSVSAIEEYEFPQADSVEMSDEHSETNFEVGENNAVPNETTVEAETNLQDEDNETSIFDMLAAKHGLSSGQSVADMLEGAVVENTAIEEVADYDETNAVLEDTAEAVEDALTDSVSEDSETSIFDTLAAQHGLLTDSPEPETEGAHEDTVEGVSEDAEESDEGPSEPVEKTVESTYPEESDTSIFDALASGYNLDLESPSGETVIEEGEPAASDDVADSTIAEETETDVPAEEADVADDDTSIFEILAAEHGLTENSVEEEIEDNVVEEDIEIVDDSASFDWFKGEDTAVSKEVPADEEEVFIPSAQNQNETFINNYETDKIEELPVEEPVEHELSIEETVEPESSVEETVEIIAEGTDSTGEPVESFEQEAVVDDESDPVIVETNINRYEYVDGETEDEDDDNDVDNSISLYKEYNSEEAGETINNTLKVQEFDAEKKLVANSSSSEVDFSIINKEYEPGEEYTVITETVIEKPAEDNPEQVKDFGSDVNINLGRDYEAPEEETVIIPEPEIDVEVSEPLVDSTKKKRKLFGKEELEAYEYEKDAVIPVAEIDEDEINQDVNEQGISREGRNIDFVAGSNEIEIGDDVYEAQQEGLSARDISEQNNDDMNALSPEEIDIDGETDEDDGTSGVSRKDLNTRQLIKDVKIIDSF